MLAPGTAPGVESTRVPSLSVAIVVLRERVLTEDGGEGGV